MFANVTVTTGAPAAVLTLPRTAIVYSLYGDNVFVVAAAPHAASPARRRKRDSGRLGGGLIVERRFVRLGPTRGERHRDRRGLEAGRARW